MRNKDKAVLSKAGTSPNVRMSWNDIKIKQLDSQHTQNHDQKRLTASKKNSMDIPVETGGADLMSNPSDVSHESIKGIKTGSSALINIIGDAKPKNPGGLKKLGALQKEKSKSQPKVLAKKKQPSKVVVTQQPTAGVK